jgi:formate dehydrogenase subunit delta
MATDIDEGLQHLIKMANQIAANMPAVGTEDDIAEKVADHIRRFWAAGMKQQLLALDDTKRLNDRAIKARQLLRG